jgi:hypothetical protein
MNRWFVRLGVPAVLFLGVIVVFAPAFSVGNWHGSHMGIRVSALLHEFTQAFVDGQLYPR